MRAVQGGWALGALTLHMAFPPWKRRWAREESTGYFRLRWIFSITVRCRLRGGHVVIPPAQIRARRGGNCTWNPRRPRYWFLIRRYLPRCAWNPRNPPPPATGILYADTGNFAYRWLLTASKRIELHDDKHILFPNGYRSED